MGATLTGVLDSYQKGGTTLLNGILGYWKLNESSGQALDSVSTNNGTLTGCVFDNDGGKIAGAVSFDGIVGSNVSMGHIHALQPTTISISVWAYGGVGYSSIVSNWDFETTYKGYNLWFSNGYPYFGADCVSAGSSITGSTPSLEAWVHLVATYDGDYLRLYRNGTSNATAVALDDELTYVTNSIFYLGHCPQGVVNDYDGWIDEVGIWNRALTQTEITELYNGGSGKTYPFS